jgi:Na+/melibiose symporter-like transporter
MNSRVSWRRIIVVVGAIVVPVAAWTAALAVGGGPQEATWGMTILVMFGLPVWLLTIFLRRRFKNQVMRAPAKGKDGLDGKLRN